MKPDLQDTVWKGDAVPFSGRDLSWLRFDERVVELAEEQDRPLLDRIRFLSISASNLDEFFMKRVALLQQRIETGLDKLTHDGLTVRQQLQAVRNEVVRIQERQAACWAQGILPRLAQEGARVTRYEALPERYRRRVDRWFREQVFPLLTPLAVDPGHPFPFISNLSLNIGVLLSAGGQERRFARLKVPDLVPAWVSVPTQGAIGEVRGTTTPARLVPVSDIIRHNLDAVFPGMTVDAITEFRLTRSVGLDEQEDDVDDVFEAVEAALRHRRFAEGVRLETHPDASSEIVQLLLEELELGPDSHFSRPGPLDYVRLGELTGLDRPDLRLPRWNPVTPERLREAGGSIFDVLREGDLLVHHPYESFRASVERFIAEAADDPDVVAIKQCLYRTDPDSPFIQSLLRAAESGKQVACLVELRARFDEGRNLQLTRTLEKHGVHVAWGVPGCKTHAKCSLVVRREGGAFRSYGHISSGNYHPVTANHYCDVGLLTADPVLTADLTQLFNFLTGHSRHDAYSRLLVAPVKLRASFEALVEQEIAHAKAGRPCGIAAKMNQLEDTRMMDLIRRASMAGVPVDLQVRGFCCLHAGVPGQTEHVRIRSVVGEFLEHARIYHFRNGRKNPLDGDWFIGSADWMERNLSNRVELITPVDGRANRARLDRILEAGQRDRRNGWDMQPDGTYVRATPGSDAAPDGFERQGSFAVLCREALTAEVDAIAAGSAASRPEPQPEAVPAMPLLAEIDRLLGLVLLDEPWRTRTEVARRAGMSPQLASRAAARLEAAGMLTLHEVGRTVIWQATPLLADAVGGPMLPLEPDRSWARQWVGRRVSAHARAAGGDARSAAVTDAITRTPGEPWTAWSFMDTLHGAKDRLARCLELDVEAVQVVVRDQPSCATMRRRIARMDTARMRVRVRTLAAVVKATGAPS